MDNAGHDSPQHPLPGRNGGRHPRRRPGRRAGDSPAAAAVPSLSERQLRFLRGKAHALKPVVLLGQKGLTDNVVAETVQALRDHELIKVKVRSADRAQREAWLGQLVARSACTLVARIGHVAVLYRAAQPTPRLVIPDAQV
jgi:RNA-binding protein